MIMELVVEDVFFKQILKLLEEFPDVINPTNNLPPHRTQDNSIAIKPEEFPLSIQLYGYPHSQEVKLKS